MDWNIYQVIWFILWAVLWTGYFVLDGFDLGAGSLIYLLGRTENDRKVIYTSIGPFWDGNEVWLITAGGATFAAFPKVYAVMFSAFYSALLLLLFCLIVRGVAVEYRNKFDSKPWKVLWDFAFFLGSVLPPFILGVAFANIFAGIPIDKNGLYHGSFWTLFHPYSILGGFLFVFCFAMHGANWIAYRATGELSERAASLSKKLWVVSIILAVLFFFGSYISTKLWENYINHPILTVFPGLALFGFFLTAAGLLRKKYLTAWIGSCLAILGFSAWGFAGLFPNMLPSSLNPAWSLTCFNSSSSLLTLKVMTVVAFIFVPIMLAYTFWAYKIFAFGNKSSEVIEY